MMWLGIILMAALLAVAPGYSQAQTPAAQPQGSEMKVAPAAPAPSYTAETRKEYEKKAAQDLDALKQQIHDLSVKAQTAAPQVKRSMTRAMLALDKQEIAARQKLGKLEKASQNDWNALKTEMDKVLDNLKKSFDNIEAHFR
jgi:hypothetical protein